MPTFERGRKGVGSIIANPAMASRMGRSTTGAGRAAALEFKSGDLSFRSYQGISNLTISGVTKDSAGTPIASCNVELFLAANDSFVARTTSDGSGNYSFLLPPSSGPYYARAIDPTLLLVGTTVETLRPA